MNRFSRIIALALPMLLACSDDRTTLVEAPSTRSNDLSPTGVAGNVEFTGAGFPKPTFPAYADLQSIRILPDPFLFFSGGVDQSPASWSRRRAEIKASIEQFEVGPKPDPRDVDVQSVYRNDSLIVTVTRKSNQRSITFRTEVFKPAGTGPFPAMIGMAWFFGNGVGSLPLDIFTSRNILRLNFYHDQSTFYINFGGAQEPYFYLYPEFERPGIVGQYSAWSWGVSRLIDGIYIAAHQATNPLPVDVSHLGVTGCSYAGKMALYAGALDERVALTIAQESGGGGIPAWRASHYIEPDGTVEKTDNTSGVWFMQSMKDLFRGDSVYKMPTDHHELMALVAPRGLLVTGNTDFVWLSNRSAYVSARAAEETYKALGVADRFGFYIDGQHNHCAIPAAQRPAIAAFVDKFLLGQDASTEVRVTPYPDLEYKQWMPWSLRNDVAALVAEGRLNAGQGNALVVKVNAAMASLAEGQTKTAFNQLNAFTNQVQAFVNSRKLTPEQGAALIATVDATRAFVLGEQ